MNKNFFKNNEKIKENARDYIVFLQSYQEGKTIKKKEKIKIEENLVFISDPFTVISLWTGTNNKTVANLILKAFKKIISSLDFFMLWDCWHHTSDKKLKNLLEKEIEKRINEEKSICTLLYYHYSFLRKSIAKMIEERIRVILLKTTKENIPDDFIKSLNMTIPKKLREIFQKTHNKIFC